MRKNTATVFTATTKSELFCVVGKTVCVHLLRKIREIRNMHSPLGQSILLCVWCISFVVFDYHHPLPPVTAVVFVWSLLRNGIVRLCGSARARALQPSGAMDIGWREWSTALEHLMHIGIFASIVAYAKIVDTTSEREMELKAKREHRSDHCREKFKRTISL